jgi:hypothetical protein
LAAASWMVVSYTSRVLLWQSMARRSVDRGRRIMLRNNSYRTRANAVVHI